MTLATIDWLSVIGFLGLGFVLGLGAMVAYTAWMLTHPPRRSEGFAIARSLPCTPAELTPPRAFESWAFKCRDGRLELPVWDVRGDAPDGATIIVTHGWGESRVLALSRLDSLARAARRVLLWDLPGHGDAPPSTCALGTREVDDLCALIEHLRRDPACGSIVLYGSSLGAGVSIAAAAQLGRSAQITLVIAEAPYRVPPTPARRVLANRALPHRLNLPIALRVIGWLTGAPIGWLREGGPFDRAALAALAACPMLVLHGNLDEVCPLEDGRAIAAAGPRGSRIEIIEGGRHLDLWTDARLRDRCAAIVASALRDRTDHAKP